MKKLFLSTLLLALPLLASAYDIAVENEDGVTIYYNYINNGTELEVAQGDYLGVVNVNIPKEVTYMSRTRKVTSIGIYAFYKYRELTLVTIPSSVTIIGNYAFGFCTSLTSVTIPNSVTSIGNYAFEYCPLTTVFIPNSVISIGENAFDSCSLTSITIPSSVTTIGKNAFYNCNGLTSVHIIDLAAWCKIEFGDNPLHYAHHLFLNGEEIKDLVIPNTVTSIGRSAFYDCDGLTSVTIPNSVTTIGFGAFEDCSSLTSVTIPNSVTSIGDYAFNGCYGLTSVTIPNSVTSIGELAFYDCSGLISLTIPSSVTKIGDNAFYRCRGLTYVISKMENPCFINSFCFNEGVFYNVTLYVPEGTREKYKSIKYWSMFVHIEEGEPTGIGLVNSKQKETEDYYSINGTHSEYPIKGINIIRKSNGTTKKVIVK